jgi:hypothetical protein
MRGRGIKKTVHKKKKLHRVSLTSLLYVSKRMRQIVGPLCLTLRMADLRACCSASRSAARKPARLPSITWLPTKSPHRPPQQQLSVHLRGPIPKLEKGKGEKRKPGAPAGYSPDPPLDLMGDAYVAKCSASSWCRLHTPSSRPGAPHPSSPPSLSLYSANFQSQGNLMCLCARIQLRRVCVVLIRKMFMHYDYALVTCAPCNTQQCASRAKIRVKGCQN